MSLPRIFFAAATAALLATSAYAETPAEAATHMPPPADTGMGMGGHGGGMRHFLSDNERMMFMVDMHKAVAGMTDDQKQAYRQQQRARFAAMSDADKAKFKADLDARWATVPADQKAEIAAKMQARMAAHQGGAAPQ